MKDLVLRKLEEGDEASFLEGASHWADEDMTWYAFDWSPGESYSSYLKKLLKNERGVEIKPTQVASSMLYAFVNGSIVGRLSIRHSLNEELSRRGGNLGYAVASKYRRKSYAKEILKQGLVYCKTIGMNKVLITCSSSNVGSVKVIEANSAQLIKQCDVDGDETCFYEISL